MKNTSQDSLRPKTFNASTLQLDNLHSTYVKRIIVRLVGISLSYALE